jgi:hypothetical protein
MMAGLMSYRSAKRLQAILRDIGDSLKENQYI